MERNDDIVKTLIVLVVDDEALLRMAAMDVLEEAGLQTLEASSADEALSLLERRDDINFVFSDIQMPGSMDGVGLATIVRRRWPNIRVVLTSGNPRPSNHPLPDHVLLMPKPYQAATLVPMVRAA